MRLPRKGHQYSDKQQRNVQQWQENICYCSQRIALNKTLAQHGALNYYFSLGPCNEMYL